MADEEREIKVVILSRGDRSSVGVQSPGCDPVFTVVDGDLEEALERVPDVLEEARTKWAEAPRYPRGEVPTPEPAPRARQSTPTQSPPARQTRQSPQQRLF